jgi:hypothetical protein
VKYMLLFIKDETEVLDEAELKARYADIDVWFAELARDNKLRGGEELQPTSTATTIRWGDGNPLVTDGPFMESKETVAGFVTIEASDLDDAIAITKRWPVKNQTVEIRPVIAHDAMPNHPAG